MPSQVETLRLEVAELQGRLDASYDLLLGGWQFGVGPLRVRAKARSGFITAVFVAFNIAVFACGVTISFFGGSWANLGTAMVVGALFAFGSFVTEFWGIQTEKERRIAEMLSETEIRDTATLFQEWKSKRRLLEQLESGQP